MALLDQILAAGAFGAPPMGFDALDAAAAPKFDEAAEAEAAREAAAQRLARGVRRPPAPFTADPVPFGGAGAGMLSGLMGGEPQAPASAPDLPPPTNDPTSGEPVPFSGNVPLPRPRPTSAPADDVLPPNMTPTTGVRAPLSLAPPVQAPPGAPQAPAQDGFSLGKIFRPENAPLFMALASGFSGAPSFGTGLRRASAAAVPPMMLLNKERQASGGQAETYRALVSKGVPPQEAIAALKNPELLKALIGRYYETKAPITVNNRLVREMPDGTIKELADYSGGKKDAPSGYQWSGDVLTFIPGGPADPKVKRQLGDRQNAPPGYSWVDPENPEKGMRAIPGGPGEKVDAQVAARLGMGQSFLDQLPSIKKSIAAGDATGAWDAVVAKSGYGRAGELRRQIDSGAEALLRNLTGAGMNMQEAGEYVRRYRLQPHDTAATVTSKLDQLERELRYTMEAVSKGRGGTPPQFRVQNGTLTDGTSAAAPSGKTKSGVTWSVE